MTALGALVLAAALAETPDAAFHKTAEVGSFRVSVKLDDGAAHSGTARVTGPADRVLLVAPAIQSVSADAVVVAGRYRGSGAASLTLHHEWRDATSGKERADEHVIAVRFPDSSPDDAAGVERALAEAQGRDALRLLDLLPDDSFSQFVVLRAKRRFRLFDGNLAPPWMRPPGRTPDLYDAFTGALSIQEALQLDGMLRTSGPVEPPTLDVRTLRPPDLKSHPFDEMRHGREPKVDEIARLVPADFWFARFSSMENCLRLVEFGDEWGSHFLKAYSAQATDAGVRARLEGLLALRTDPALRPFYGLAVSEVAACGSDPFLVEGSDLTLVFRLRNRAMFETRVRELRAERRAAVPGAAETKETIAGVEVTALTSPDGAVSSYLTWIDDVAIVSTSRVAMERVLGTRPRTTPALADAADFRCLRAIAPGGAPDEDAFVYLSDAFVRRVVGPDLKVAEARRVECVACLRTIENAALLFRMENGRDPADLVEMWPDYVKDGALRCPSGGAYSFASTGARCLVHLSLTALRPCLETPVTMVTPTESRDYDRFARRYNDYWRQYFDPIAIRVTLGDTVRAETTILPLVENSAYDAARGWVGGAAAAPIGPEPPSAIASLAARIDLRSVLPDAVTCRELREKFGVDVERAAAKAFGPEVAIDVGDGDLRFDFRLERYLGGALSGGSGVDLYLIPALAGLSLPVSARVGVRDREAASAFVREVREALARESARPNVLPSAPRFSTYALAPHRGVPVSVVAMEALSFKVRLYHALLDDAWIVANQEAFLREAIDKRLGGAAPGEPAHAKLEMLPQAWRQAKSALLLSYEESARLACARNLGVAGHVLRATRGAGDVARRALERRVFGQLGTCPDGGAYREGADGLAECTIHGSLTAPRQLAEPAPDAPFGRLVARLRAVRLTARFTDDGLQTTVEIERH